MTSKARFARNFWYVAAWSREIGDKPFARRLLGEPIVLFRGAEGRIGALTDRCPHRLVPLSLGVCANGRLRCAYHGMEFDGAGKCVHIPGQSAIPPSAHTRSFPTIERYGLIWIWLGETSLADPAKVPCVERHGQPGWEMLQGGYQYHPSNYRNIIENLMDPAHTTFVHSNTIANPMAGDVPVKTERTDQYILAYRWVDNTPPTAHDRRRLNVSDDLSVDRGQFFYFYLPSTSRVETIVLPAGTERIERNLSSGLHTYSYKFLTPETESATHFFWLHIRNYLLNDPEAATKLRNALEQTFGEDLVIETAMQRAQEETGLRQLTALEIDRAPIMALRMLDRLIAAEQPRSVAATSAD